MNLRNQDAEGHSRRGTLNAREMAMHLYFSPDQFKRLEWAVEMPAWPRLPDPLGYAAPKVKLPHEKLDSPQTFVPPQTEEAKENGVKGVNWRFHGKTTAFPSGASRLPHERSTSEYPIKNKMSNEEAISAMESLGHDFFGHEDKIHDILNKVRRDEWPGIVDHYVD